MCGIAATCHYARRGPDSERVGRARRFHPIIDLFHNGHE
jgi:hypothetical protein